MKIDFLAVGDITTDAFIRLGDAQVQDIAHDGVKYLCMRFGEKLLYDDLHIVPAAGNCANAAIAARRLGLVSALCSNVGDDEHGLECLGSLEKERVITDYIKTNSGKKSNYNFVLQFGPERTILVKHAEFRNEFPAFSTPPAAIYLSSLAINSLPFHEEIARYVEKNPSTKLIFQPGTQQIKFGYESLQDIYQKTELFFCNVEEAQAILKTNSRDIKTLLRDLKELGPRVPIITDGPNGAYTFFEGKTLHIPIFPDPTPPIDRTGAGDSFSSTFSVFYLCGYPVAECLRRSPINAMSVVHHIGAHAGLLDREEIERYLQNASENYLVREI